MTTNSSLELLAPNGQRLIGHSTNQDKISPNKERFMARASVVVVVALEEVKKIRKLLIEAASDKCLRSIC
jgi:hypothetical protein